MMISVKKNLVVKHIQTRTTVQTNCSTFSAKWPVLRRQCSCCCCNCIDSSFSEKKMAKLPSLLVTNICQISAKPINFPRNWPLLPIVFQRNLPQKFPRISPQNQSFFPQICPGNPVKFDFFSRLIRSPDPASAARCNYVLKWGSSIPFPFNTLPTLTCQFCTQEHEYWPMCSRITFEKNANFIQHSMQIQVILTKYFCKPLPSSPQ